MFVQHFRLLIFNFPFSISTVSENSFFLSLIWHALLEFDLFTLLYFCSNSIWPLFFPCLRYSFRFPLLFLLPYNHPFFNQPTSTISDLNLIKEEPPSLMRTTPHHFLFLFLFLFSFFLYFTSTFLLHLSSFLFFPKVRNLLQRFFRFGKLFHYYLSYLLQNPLDFFCPTYLPSLSIIFFLCECTVLTNASNC